MFEKEVIGICLFLWRDVEKLTSSDARSLNKSKTGWGTKIERTTIFSIDWEKLPEEPPEKPKKKAETAGSPKEIKAPKGVKALGPCGGETKKIPNNSLESNNLLKQLLLNPSIDGLKLKEDLGVLVGYVIKLKNSLHQANSGGDAAEKIVLNIDASILAIAADLDLGMHNSLNELSKAVMPCKK